jgi:hypothetical protein
MGYSLQPEAATGHVVSAAAIAPVEPMAIVVVRATKMILFISHLPSPSGSGCSTF